MDYNFDGGHARNFENYSFNSDLGQGLPEDYNYITDLVRDCLCIMQGFLWIIVIT